MNVSVFFIASTYAVSQTMQGFPRVNSRLEESAKGLGEYDFVENIGEGMLGTVFRALRKTDTVLVNKPEDEDHQHPDFGAQDIFAKTAQEWKTGKTVTRCGMHLDLGERPKEIAVSRAVLPTAALRRRIGN